MNITPIDISLTISTNKEPRADSRVIATHLDIQHESVLKMLKEYEAGFKELGFLRFEIGKIEGRGRPERFAMLNEDQAHFLLSLSRPSPRTVPLKLALVKAFRDSRRALAAYQEGTLPTHKALQDAIQAVPGGPGQWLHSNINKLVNITAAVTAGTRPACDATTQAVMTLLQSVAAKAVRGAADAKDAYARAKAVLQPLSALAEAAKPALSD